jgi:hypothetical protein
MNEYGDMDCGWEWTTSERATILNKKNKKV